MKNTFILVSLFVIVLLSILLGVSLHDALQARKSEEVAKKQLMQAQEELRTFQSSITQPTTLPQQ